MDYSIIARNRSFIYIAFFFLIMKLSSTQLQCSLIASLISGTSRYILGLSPTFGGGAGVETSIGWLHLKYKYMKEQRKYLCFGVRGGCSREHSR